MRAILQGTAAVVPLWSIREHVRGELPSPSLDQSLAPQRDHSIQPVESPLPKLHRAAVPQLGYERFCIYAKHLGCLKVLCRS